MSDEACPRDLPEQGVQPMISLPISNQGQSAGPPVVHEQHDTNPDNQ
jgi:hypothetical protein